MSVKDVAALLSVSEKTIYRMIKNETIPCFRVGGQWRFDRREITSWMEDTREFSYETAVGNPTRADEESISIAEFLRRGGIYYRVSGGTKEEAISASLELIRMRIPELDPKRLFDAIMSRERICPTAVGHGIAFPHPRPFKEFTAPLSSIALCCLANPIPFGALDKEAVDTLFFIFPKSEQRFLRIQAKLLRLLKEQDILAALKRESPEELYEAFAGKETEIFGGEK
ncbi:MAG: PTS sugar transporter subunit IIA [Alphaproteobacteria bacterium]|uniref:PTS sugar transporter subunit IIA n=1 Tax=Candidatus Nitrobium versatile TaxID=2884831 RepID=A0A953J5C4_9BACT|nr:PTS sugar transporter subunit IIA [Candidatus Nitrobium versatile]